MLFPINNRKIKIYRACIGCVRHKSSTEQKMKTYSNTIIVPKTDFPVRTKNFTKEDIQENARFSELYNWQRANLTGPEYVVHDGPPYANGDMHMGHAVNKIIKDICNRSQVLQGNKVHFVPGWDCHGLPIELKALQKAKKMAKDANISNPIQVRETARKFALETVEKQKESFVSWGIMADWDKQYYLTLRNSYVKNQLKKFYEMYKKGVVYRALKPVHWSPASRTALAEAELEYDTKFKSQEVYVQFPLQSVPKVIQELVKSKKLHAIIWTTTPWSLVANRAICYSPQLKYCLVTLANQPENHLYIICNTLIEALKTTLGVDIKTVVEFEGSNLRGSTYTHSLLERTLPFLEAEHVTDSKGTGLVHNAPAHGPEDFLVALRNNMAVDCNVDDYGCYTDLGPSLSALNGLSVLKEGQSEVISRLASDVLYSGTISHSYPLDWRTKTPVIMRATSQWFVDTHALKDDAQEALESVEFLPQASAVQHRAALCGQVARRPYWCVSRQRAWGVPIPAVYRREEALMDSRIVDRLCDLIESRGPDAWWTCDVADLVPKEVLEKKGWDIKDVTKGQDIMDIWLDSGLSWSQLDGRRSRLYAEGVDQLTGWFQTSLLTSVALQKKAPYESIFIHGFVVDEKRRKMSKSIGNVIDPKTIISGGKDKMKHPAYGVDALRWWVASHGTQHSQIIVSRKLLDDCQSEITRIRNLMKYLLGALADLETDDFDEKPVLNYLDKYMINETHDFLKNIRESYDGIRYNSVVQSVLFFISNKVSPLYCHCVKDRLYCSTEKSNERLSAQLVINTILIGLCKGLGPILPHLVEEVWQHHPLYKNPFFYTQNLPMLPSQDIDGRIMDKVLDIKSGITAKATVENLKKFQVKIKTNSSIYETLSKLNNSDGFNDSVLCEILDVASVEVEECSLEDKEWDLEVNLSNKSQCCRCRKYNALEHSDKCLRCENVLLFINY